MPAAASPTAAAPPVRASTAPCSFAAHRILTSHILSPPNNCRRQKTCFLPIFYIQEICTACSLHIIRHVKILHSLVPSARRSITRQRKCRARGSSPIPRGPERAAECGFLHLPLGRQPAAPPPGKAPPLEAAGLSVIPPGKAGEGAGSLAGSGEAGVITETSKCCPCSKLSL